MKLNCKLLNQDIHLTGGHACPLGGRCMCIFNPWGRGRGPARFLVFVPYIYLNFTLTPISWTFLLNFLIFCMWLCWTIVSNSPLVKFSIESLLHGFFAGWGRKNWPIFSNLWLFDPFFELQVSPTRSQHYWTRRDKSACKKLH